MYVERSQMKNQVYRLSNGSGIHLDIWIVDTNEINPVKDIKEIAITIYDNKDLQIDFDLDEDDIKSLMNYLENSLEYIEKFNKESKPIEE